MMKIIQPQYTRCQWCHLLIAALVTLCLCPSLVLSAPSATTKSQFTDHLRPKVWGLPKIETSFFGSHRRSNAEDYPKKIIVMGAPASGKGTQCQALVEEHGLVHLSTGDMLRQAVSSKSADSEIAKCMKEGRLIPDDIIVRLVLDRLRQPDCQERGWILDGFPRTSSQARALKEAGIVPDIFLFLDVPDKVAIKRACGRRTDPVTGNVYHLDFNPPPQDNDIKKRLVQRSDDTVESMKQRLKQFRVNANAVKGCYDVVEIDGSIGTPSDVRNEIHSSLKRFAQKKMQTCR